MCSMSYVSCHVKYKYSSRTLADHSLSLYVSNTVAAVNLGTSDKHHQKHCQI